jgi:hypothetical protein
MFGKEVHSKIYFIGLACLAASLPLSIFTTSLFEILLAANWLLEGNFRNKFRVIRERRSLWYILSIYLVFLAGLIITKDFAYAFHDLRIKLPILVLALIMGLSEPISSKQFKWVLLFLIGGVVISSFSSILVLAGIIDHAYSDLREISLFIDHIRFSLLIDLAIFSLLYIIFERAMIKHRWEGIIYALLLCWLVVFLFILQAITGIFIFLAVGSILFWVYLHKIPTLVLRWTLGVFMIAGSLIVLSYVSRSIGRFYQVEEIDREQIDMTTINGNPYVHDFTQPFIENGHYIWLYLCEPELEKEWNKISDIDYNVKDEEGNEIKYIIIRYMTSKGLRKDSAGVSQLLAEDVRLIEEGKSNYLFGKKFSFKNKLYDILWQIDVYRKDGNSSGHSITQRILYLQAALDIIRDHFWIGVGTGNVADSYNTYYEHVNSPLTERWRLRAHNQFLTFLLTYGIVGFIWILVGILYPVYLERKWNDYFMIMFLLIGFLSMLNEDTLETHTGVSFFAFFYSLFLFVRQNKKPDLTENGKPDK